MFVGIKCRDYHVNIEKRVRVEISTTRRGIATRPVEDLVQSSHQWKDEVETLMMIVQSLFI